MPDLLPTPRESTTSAGLTLEAALLMLDQRGWVRVGPQCSDRIALHYFGAVDPEPHDLTLAPYEVMMWAAEIIARQQRQPPTQLSLFDLEGSTNGDF